MKEYAYETLDLEGFFVNGTEDYRKIIDAYAEKGYRYVGCIPTKMVNGSIRKMDLIFERDKEEN